MAFDDLRSFLQALDDHGQLLKISEEVNAEPDLAAAANATGRIGDGAPALWFDNIRGFTDARVAMNTIGSWQNHAISLGLPPNAPVKKQIDEFIRRWDNFPIAPLTGFDVPWGSEVILEGVIESRKREIEGPFGEFTGHYSGGRNMTVVRIDKVSYRTRPIFESLYLGMPWTEIDYLMGPATCVPLYQQLKAEFPEVQAVNAMYTHGLLAIISTKKRYGGFARAVGLRAMTTPHGLGYVKMVIMVDEDVDPFNLPQVMWALSSKVNPAGDLVQLPNMSVLELDPGSSPAGITDKLIIDATTPVAPDNRGHYSQPVVDLPETKAWAEKLTAMLAARK
ncbi:UbiD family decarboxylase [Escherichia coli]|nr:UbiD family decarboxylase [Escherichia coli]